MIFVAITKMVMPQKQLRDNKVTPQSIVSDFAKCGGMHRFSRALHRRHCLQMATAYGRVPKPCL